MNMLRNKQGQGMIEYLMIAAFAVALAIFLYKTVRPSAEKNMTNIATQMGNPGN